MDIVSTILHCKWRACENINVWLTFMYSQKWNCAALLFPKQNYNVLSPNIHIHVSVSDLYMPMISMQRTDFGNIIYKSLTDTVHKYGRTRNFISGNICSKFLAQCGLLLTPMAAEQLLSEKKWDSTEEGFLYEWEMQTFSCQHISKISKWNYEDGLVEDRVVLFIIIIIVICVSLIMAPVRQ